MAEPEKSNTATALRRFEELVKGFPGTPKREVDQKDKQRPKRKRRSSRQSY